MANDNLANVDRSALSDGLVVKVVALLEAKNAHALNAKVAETATQLDQHLLDILG